jgi:hypothetical protein
MTSFTRERASHCSLFCVKSNGRFLISKVETQDGNLGQHIEILKPHGLVTIRKGHEGHRARTWVKITWAGDKALASEIRTLKSLLNL